jgi:hypothetical protein
VRLVATTTYDPYSDHAKSRTHSALLQPKPHERYRNSDAGAKRINDSVT